MRTAADAAGVAIMAITSEPAIKSNVMPLLLNAMAPRQNWQTKLAANVLFVSLTERFPEGVAQSLPEVVPAISQIMNDAKPQVKVSRHTTTVQLHLSSSLPAALSTTRLLASPQRSSSITGPSSLHALAAVPAPSGTAKLCQAQVGSGIDQTGLLTKLLPHPPPYPHSFLTQHRVPTRCVLRRKRPTSP